MTQWLIKLSAPALDLEKHRCQEEVGPTRQPDKTRLLLDSPRVKRIKKEKRGEEEKVEVGALLKICSRL